MTSESLAYRTRTGERHRGGRGSLPGWRGQHGRGLAIGAAFAAGELGPGSFLVIGFALHNTTEGLGVVAPVARDRPFLWHFAGMGLLAGIPTILGTWIGGFSYSPDWITFFLALGVGAILEVQRGGPGPGGHVRHGHADGGPEVGR